jgi:hypothetical protein
VSISRHRSKKRQEGYVDERISNLYHHFTNGGMSGRDFLDRLTGLVLKENRGFRRRCDDVGTAGETSPARPMAAASRAAVAAARERLWRRYLSITQVGCSSG